MSQHMSLEKRRRRAEEEIVWRAEEVIFADKKGVSHSLRVWS